MANNLLKNGYELKLYNSENELKSIIVLEDDDVLYYGNRWKRSDLVCAILSEICVAETKEAADMAKDLYALLVGDGEINEETKQEDKNQALAKALDEELKKPE